MTQLRAHFRPTAARRSAAARLAGAAALALTLSACQLTLYSGLSQQDANLMVAALLRAGVPAERAAAAQGEGFAVVIDEADMPRAMAALEREGLPRQGFQSLGDVFAKEGLLSSPTEERARLVYATSQELAETISQIDGVLAARIHVVLPEERGLGAAAGGAAGGSASVFIRHRADADIEALTPDIKMLVTKSIANLSYDEVSIIRVAATTPGGEATPPALDRAFGFWVLDADAPRLRTALGGLGALALLAIAAHGAWFWLWRTGRLGGAPARAVGPAAAAAAPRRPRRVA